MATLNFTIAYSTTLEGVLSMTPSTTVYVEDYLKRFGGLSVVILRVLSFTIKKLFKNKN